MKEEHTEFPLGYMEASMTAGVLLRAGYKQRKCICCNLFTIWEDKKTGVFLKSYKEARPLERKINLLAKKRGRKPRSQ